jgi:beta-glucosidase/6-phospho-beta-glucosidase/beta-galactosidase
MRETDFRLETPACNAPALFPSFFHAGFECSTPINRHGVRIDPIVATEHDRRAQEDYRALRRLGIRTVREGVRWNLIDRGGRYDFRPLRPFLEAAQQSEITPIWDLFHYGYPDDLDPFSEAFVRQFADYCHAVAGYIDRRTYGTPFFTPINEISYFAWAAGDAGVFAPFERGRSFDLKVNLVRAALAGIAAIRDVNPRARIVNADPICKVVAPVDRPDLEAHARWYSQHVVYETWDMLAGRQLQELGGNRSHLDIIGVNYYWTNQWELPANPFVPGPVQHLCPGDPRLTMVSDLLSDISDRYGGDLLITETAHVGPLRAPWLRYVTEEARIALRRGVRLHGICLYPVLGMPEWHEPEVTVRMGLWDLEPDEEGIQRVPDEDVLRALREEMARWPARPHARDFSRERAIAYP